jgi:hypothetical protein
MLPTAAPHLVFGAVHWLLLGPQQLCMRLPHATAAASPLGVWQEPLVHMPRLVPMPTLQLVPEA